MLVGSEKRVGLGDRVWGLGFDLFVSVNHAWIEFEYIK